MKKILYIIVLFIGTKLSAYYYGGFSADYLQLGYAKQSFIEGTEVPSWIVNSGFKPFGRKKVAIEGEVVILTESRENNTSFNTEDNDGFEGFMFNLYLSKEIKVTTNMTIKGRIGYIVFSFDPIVNRTIYSGQVMYNIVRGFDVGIDYSETKDEVSRWSLLMQFTY